MNENKEDINSMNTFHETIDYSYIKGELGKRLLDTRKSLNISQEDAAKSLGISRVSLGYYERGERSIDIEILYKISRLYDVSIDYLFGNTPNSEPQYNYNESDEARTIGFSSSSLDYMWGNSDFVELVDDILQHEKFSLFEELTYRTRYTEYEDYDRHYRSFLVSQLLYEMISDIFEGWYPDNESRINTLKEIKDANIEADIQQYLLKINCIKNKFESKKIPFTEDEINNSLNELLNKLKRLS